ncbi:PQQ-dependent sugar dehydrogenase [Legionella sp. 27cVA30]|uniref:PQQ-dependent sugar dehydrogenase n=1 Tax=Legionella sp. 27cVA30 TaxID=2905657 RepID=UPI0020A14464|nr:PQQ-dependent sugar dehydrogenase [Legionella sp. 27cVA30]MCP0914524.1 PQQ-dependent sugar dehydrogenase [Legionella sp. 27cVA30]
MRLQKVKLIFIMVVTLIFLGLFAFIGRNHIIPLFFLPTAPKAQAGKNHINYAEELVAVNLNAPWEMVFLPNHDFLVTERNGKLRQLGKVEKTLVVPDVYPVGEGGLLGMALDPDFPQNHHLYLYFTTKKNGKPVNQVVRYVYPEKGELVDKTIILADIPAARFHNGGRIKFGPDGYLYVSTGDAQDPESAQQRTSLAGKILRITKDGMPAPNNPFNTAVYSFGHRNPQGLAWDEQGQLWATEHGQSHYDELNLILAGKNYGWPQSQGYQQAKGIKPPVLTSGGKETWAPSGLCYAMGNLFFTGLRGQALYQVPLDPQKIKIGKLNMHFHRKYGRLRNAVCGKDGFLYLMTANTDGRGWAGADDDKIIRVKIRNLY